MKSNRRTQIVVDWKAQSRFAVLIVLAAASAVFLQTALTAAMLGRIAGQLPNDGRQLMEVAPSALAANAASTLAVTVPWLVLMSILGTFRYFGPVVSIRSFLKSVAAGERSAPLSIRDSDKLHDICHLLNEVSQPMREEIAARPKAASQSDADQPADEDRRPAA